MHVTISTRYLLLTGPNDQVSIKWETNSGSGSTECVACELQHNINVLERSGYQVIGVDRV